MFDELFVLNKLKEGDIKSFETIFRRYYSPLCLFAASIVNQYEVAEEIIQDLFYIIWRDRNSLQVTRSLKSYLYGAVKYRALQYIEHSNVRIRYKEKIISQRIEPESDSPQDELEYQELETFINRTLGKMPERRREIFQMHRLEGKKYSEIAEIMSLSVKTIEAEITKALKMLRKEIEKYTHK